MRIAPSRRCHRRRADRRHRQIVEALRRAGFSVERTERFGRKITRKGVKP